MCGVMIDNYNKLQEVDTKTWISFLISPITLPIILGMVLNNK